MLLALACGLAWARGAGAGVYNIHLYTDSAPDFVDRESFLRSVLPASGTPRQRGGHLALGGAHEAPAPPR
jgi:hypothetical protein